MAGSIETILVNKSSFESHTKKEKSSMTKLFEDTNEWKYVEKAFFAKQSTSSSTVTKALNELHQSRQLLLNTLELDKKRTSSLTLLAGYETELAETNPARFPYLSDIEKIRLKKKLIQTYHLLYELYQLDAAEERDYSLKKRQKNMDLCSKYIWLLEYPDLKEKENFEVEHEKELSFFTKCLYYLGITIFAEWIIDRIDQFVDCKTGAIKMWLTEINTKRLYWIWSGSLLSATLAFLPDNFFNTVGAKETLSSVSEITGYLSWILYYMRLGVNLYLVVKHTCPWGLSEEEAKIPAWERFKTQLDQRKYLMINDFFWGLANMVTFFWLRGKGTLGYAGGITNLVLFSMDFFVAIIAYWEESTKHEADMEAIQRDIEALYAKKKGGSISKKEFDEELKLLMKLKAKMELDWQYKEQNLLIDCVSALSLLIGFAAIICFLCPPATVATFLPLSVLIIGICGAGFCFIASTLCTAMRAKLAMNKSEDLSELNEHQCNKLLDEFNAAEMGSDKRKDLFLQMYGLMANSQHQLDLAHFQLIQGIRSLLIDSIFPVLVFVGLIFLPTGAGLAVIAAAIAISIISYAIVNQYQPKADQLPEFDQEEFDAFENDPNLKWFYQFKLIKEEQKYLLDSFSDDESEDSEFSDSDTVPYPC